MEGNISRKRKNKKFSKRKEIQDSTLVQSIRGSIKGPEYFATVVQDLVENGVDV